MSHDFWRAICDARGTIHAVDDEEGVRRTCAPIDMEDRLRRLKLGATLEGERLPAVSTAEIRGVAERFFGRARGDQRRGCGEGCQALREEGAFDAAEMRRVYQKRVVSMNQEQRAFVEDAYVDVRAGRQSGVFLEAPAGTGKIFSLNTLLAGVRGDGKIAVAVATSGIAAILLTGDRTFHSRFKAPLGESQREHPVQRCAGGQPRGSPPGSRAECVGRGSDGASTPAEGLDRTLRDICDDERHFGGVVVVVSGDFRQSLPVVPRAAPAQVVAASLKCSPLWRHFRLMRLIVNMRLVGASPATLAFARFLENIGDSVAGAEEFGPPDDRGKRRCRFPSRLCLEGGIQQLVVFVFPGLADGDAIVGDNAILASTNKVVDDVIENVTARFGEKMCVSSPPTRSHRMTSSGTTSRSRF